MFLPNAHFAVVERQKITEYLLNPEHRYGASKARFFAAFGFAVDAWEVLANALQEHAQTLRNHSNISDSLGAAL
jgi:hypothetical protein